MDLVAFIESIGYLGIAAVVFSESGLFLGAFFPGDSLLFTAGFLASQHVFDIRILIPLMFLAAVLGDSFGYAFGRRLGPKIFSREDSLLFHRDHLERSKRFYERHGGKTIILARFMPIVRTFAPILAGVGRMRYGQFLFFNVIGALIWAVGISYLGFVLGDTVPGVDKYLIPIILLIILTSVAPTMVSILRNPSHRRAMIDAVKKILKVSPKKIPLNQHYRNTSLEGFANVIPLGSSAAETGQEFERRFGSKEWYVRALPLRLKTTFRLGGPADFFLTPRTAEDTQSVVKTCHELKIPLFVLGGGSNVLFSDAGWRGVVLQPSNNTITFSNREIDAADVIENPTSQSEGSAIGQTLRSSLEHGPRVAGSSERGGAQSRAGGADACLPMPSPNDARWEMSSHDRPSPPQKPATPDGLPVVEVKAGAGTSLQQLIATAHQERLVGLESFFGIPARVGGALRNNVHGGPDNFDRYVKEVTLLHIHTGEITTWPHDRFAFSYDHNILQQTREWLVWDVTLMLSRADEPLWQKIDVYYKAWQSYKNTTQTAAGTAGCVFKNIPSQDAAEHHIPVSAGANIDRLFGLGTALRTAHISTFHGNFLQSPGNKEQGTSEDMLSLINFIREETAKKTGIALETEIEFVGF
ncbi:MAG: VTT domain-containing protein [Patescibacteria group bacterium]